MVKVEERKEQGGQLGRDTEEEGGRPCRAERVGAERVGAERVGAERVGAERVGAERGNR
jgi:hypothetical protein